jgi:hypothetical protein
MSDLSHLSDRENHLTLRMVPSAKLKVFMPRPLRIRDNARVHISRTLLTPSDHENHVILHMILSSQLKVYTAFRLRSYNKPSVNLASIRAISSQSSRGPRFHKAKSIRLVPPSPQLLLPSDNENHLTLQTVSGRFKVHMPISLRMRNKTSVYLAP